LNSFRLQVPEKARPVFDRGYRFYGLHGGRGSTKSHVFATKGIIRMMQQRFRLLCVREVQRSIADSVHQLLCNKIEEAGLRPYFDITDAYIRGPNESVAIFRGMQAHTAASVKSMEDLDAAWVEEGQTLSQKSLDLLIPTIRAPGSEVWASWNPEDESDPIEFLRQPMPEALVIEMNWRDNPWFPDVLRQDMLRDRERDPEKADWIWEGRYRGASEARIFRNYRVGEVEVPDNVVWFYGVDWGFSVDPLAGVRFCFPSDRTLYITHEAYRVGVPTEDVPAYLLECLPDLAKWPSIADSARPESIDYCRRHGIPRMKPAIKGKGSIEDGITFLQGQDIVIHPRCVNVKREFDRYSYKRDRQTEEILPVVEDAWNHGIDCLRMASERLHRKGKLTAEGEKLVRVVRDYGHNDPEDFDSWKVA
jgi:phage terminase large subunit